MKAHNYFVIRLAAFALLAACLANPALALKKTRYAAQGNNVGVVFSTISGDGPFLPRWSGLHQFPRGSANTFWTQNWGWYTAVVRDLDNDGTVEDTTIPAGRGFSFITNAPATLELYDEIEAAWNSGARVNQVLSSNVNINRIFSSLDPDDRADWPAEFREGRVLAGAPVLRGSENVVMRVSDAFSGGAHVPAMGASIEYNWTFLNFAETNNMIFGHVFVRNMSEYLKWHPDQAHRDAVAGTPDGQTWAGLMMIHNMGYIAIGGMDEGFIYHPAKEVFGTIDNDGQEPGFTPGGNTFIIAEAVVNPPAFNGETATLTNYTSNETGGDFGYSLSVDVYASGHDPKIGYRAGLGIEPLAQEEINPFTNRIGFGNPGVLSADDARYNQWLWNAHAKNKYVSYSELHDIAPRDTFSLDYVVMFVMPDNPPLILPRPDIANIDDPVVQQQLAPVENYLNVARAVFAGGFVTPATPVPPPLTIIPGDRQVTITWSDINVTTADPYYSFLQDNPELDPEGVYREFDFEGFRLFRSFVGPSESHAKLIDSGSISQGNVHFSFVDRREDDFPLRRMRNGMKVWYALVPYDKNFDPATGEELSLPAEGSGKVWNRPGELGLYTVLPRSNAGEFRPGEVGTVSQLYPAGVSPETASNALLEFDVQIINHERLMNTQSDTLFVVVVDSVKAVPDVKKLYPSWGRYFIHLENQSGRSLSSVTALSQNEGKLGPQFNGLTAEEDINFPQLNPDINEDGLIFSVNFKLGNTNITDGADWDFWGKPTTGIDNYTAQLVGAPANFHLDPTVLKGNDWSDRGQGSGLGAGWDAPGNPNKVTVYSHPGMLRYGEIEVTWVSAGADLTLSVFDKTNGVAVPFSADPGMSWGFVTASDAAFYEAFRKWKSAGGFGFMSDRVPASAFSGEGSEVVIYLNGHYVQVLNNSGPPSGSFTLSSTGIGVNGIRPAVPGNRYMVTIKPPTMDPEDADLSKIRVVPNPYIASSILDLSAGNRRIEFINLPSRCTIRIYSMGGKLVNVLNHIGANRYGWGNYTDMDRLTTNVPLQLTGYDNHGGTEPWNMRNRFSQTVASGLYFYHVTDQLGREYTGKFYIVN